MFVRSDTYYETLSVLGTLKAKIDHDSFKRPSPNDSSQTSFPVAMTARCEQDAEDELRKLVSLFN